jgi:histone deacetylase complex regulatory component SIN3
VPKQRPAAQSLFQAQVNCKFLEAPGCVTTHHSLIPSLLPFTPRAALSDDDWATAAAALHQLPRYGAFAGDEHPPGMPFPSLPFPSLPAVRNGARKP